MSHLPPPPVPGGVAPKFGSENVSRYTGVSQLQLRVSRYTVQLPHACALLPRLISATELDICPDPPIPAFSISLLFLAIFRLSLLFLAIFLAFPRISGFREERNPCFFFGRNPCFFQKSKVWRVRVNPIRRCPLSAPQVLKRKCLAMQCFFYIAYHIAQVSMLCAVLDLSFLCNFRYLYLQVFGSLLPCPDNPYPLN